MIGYYAHHHGNGHLHRAEAVAAALDEPVTGLSSLPPPSGWRGDWVQLPRDDAEADPEDVTAGDQLHWVPVHESGLRARSAAISQWIDRAGPRLVVADVSVEFALLARLHGVPVVTVVLPGRRADPAHLLGFRASTALAAFSPVRPAELLPGVPGDVVQRVVAVGALSRFPASDAPPVAGADRRVLVLVGRGGSAMASLDVTRLEAATPGWTWARMGGPDEWVDDISTALRETDVVVTNAGDGSLADVAAHRRPAVVVPAERPFAEQHVTASALGRHGWPAVVRPRLPAEHEWLGILDRAAALDGGRWQAWCDGHAAERFARLLGEVGADRRRRRSA